MTLGLHPPGQGTLNNHGAGASIEEGVVGVAFPESAMQENEMTETSAARSGAVEERPVVNVIIPTWDRDDLLHRCLNHLGLQTLTTFQIVVVDNGNGNGKAPASPVRTLPNVKWVPLAKNRGTSVAFNRGLAECPQAEYILLLNNDVELERDCLAHLVRALEDNPEYSAAVPKLLQWANPKLLDGVGDDILLGGGAYRVGYGELDVGQYDKPEPVFSACAAAALYRRSFLEALGGFDEDFFAYRDDVDLFLRAQLRGYRCLYVPQARARHHGSATLGSPFHPLVIRLSTRNHILCLVKNYPTPVLLRLALRLIVFQILWAGLAVRKHGFLAWCQGVLGALRHLPAMLGKRREVMGSNILASEVLLARLRGSEERIRRWQESPYNQRPSRLLRLYFRIFGP